MPLVRMKRRLAINVTGYDRDAVVLEPGEHEVHPRVAEWVAAHPEWGEVRGGKREQTAAPEDEGETDGGGDPDGPGGSLDLSKLSVPELRSLLGERAPKGRATKAELIALIGEAEA